LTRPQREQEKPPALGRALGEGLERKLYTCSAPRSGVQLPRLRQSRIDLDQPNAVGIKCHEPQPTRERFCFQKNKFHNPSNRVNSVPKRISFQYRNLNCLIWPNYRDYVGPGAWFSCLLACAQYSSPITPVASIEDFP